MQDFNLFRDEGRGPPTFVVERNKTPFVPCSPHTAIMGPSPLFLFLFSSAAAGGIFLFCAGGANCEVLRDLFYGANERGGYFTP